MNICFLMGKLLCDPIFEFIYMNKKISICYFQLKLFEGNVITVFGYDEKADYMYKKLNKEDRVLINGKVSSIGNSFKVEIIKVEKII